MSNGTKYFSTFSGIGGFELALRKQCPNAQCVGHSEIDRHALKIYRRHFPKHTNFGDIRKVEPESLPDFNLLIGGFPCQAFSIAGKQRGFYDPRGTLFFEIARLARKKQPRLLLLENVKGLLSHNAGTTFSTILTTLHELGYDLQWQVLNSKNYGVPHNRARVFIVGHLRTTGRPNVFPIRSLAAHPPNKPASDKTRKCVRPIWTQRDPLCARRAILNRHTIRRLTPTEYERLQGFPDGWTAGLSDQQRYRCLGNAVTVPVVERIVAKLLNTGVRQHHNPYCFDNGRLAP